MKKLLFLLFLTSLAAEDYISGVFIQPVRREFDMSMEANNDEYVVEEALIDDIRTIMSAMVYGWKFHYVPSNQKREIEEIFTLIPIAEIKKGDSHMEFHQDWVEENIMYVNVSYKLRDFQEKRVKGWMSDNIPSSTGKGSAPLYNENGKMDAVKEALKDAVKNYYVSRGKPRLRNIEGEIFLKENPRVFIDAGSWNVIVQIKLKIKKSENYRYH